MSNPDRIYQIGVDIGSTTVKAVVLLDGDVVYSEYRRHHSRSRETTISILSEITEIVDTNDITLCLTGSAALKLSEITNTPFVQEVIAAKIAACTLQTGVDVVIELGGEDAKILFLTDGCEERMNGTCAGGTGAFIDQMASLLSLSVTELDRFALKAKHVYSIASRCGVFAKSDIQPLLNQGADKADIAASIYGAIISQTIAGLTQGREIKGKVLFLGGPLTFLDGLKKQFKETLLLSDENAVFPSMSEYYVAIGAAIESVSFEKIKISDITTKIKNTDISRDERDILPPLFENEDEYNKFCERHYKNTVASCDIHTYEGDAFLGIDAGSTSTKIVLINENSEILYSFYGTNSGDPLFIIIDKLKEIYFLCENRIKIKTSAVTGYGEEMLLKAFSLDFGIVETAAHYYAAKHFNPDVDFIIDIGGQDMKCFKLKNGNIESIMLNEACSSGCGSFIESFASAMGYNVEDFAKQGTFAKHPVNLGSRCTVFMNSSVKQAQNDGASVQDISAGLSISVVKNAIYKVIRANDAKAFGNNIVVQGGTFLNDVILRAFEMETGQNVIRPSIAGIMGAYGAALYSLSNQKNDTKIISKAELFNFSHKSKISICKICTNNCRLTVSAFNTGAKFISGNRCERGLGKAAHSDLPDCYEYKINKLLSYKPIKGERGNIGIPLVLNNFELAPFWYTLFTKMGFTVHFSSLSTRKTYINGQHTIPSDTVCYPAKLVHGHILELIYKNIETVFYPCMPYNINEMQGDNHYNCPVVAYYPELIAVNINDLDRVIYLNPYFAVHDKRKFKKMFCEYAKINFDVAYNVASNAIAAAYLEQQDYMDGLYKFGESAIEYANENNKNIIILAGRPYHADPEINHGINKLLTSLDCVVISEDCIKPSKKEKSGVLNQWTYHNRIYNAARFALEHENVNLIQLVSFGCGLDAITTDETKDILFSGRKIYTAIKIDEINNLGAAKIRIRSLLEAIKVTGAASVTSRRKFEK